jgi:hypothetical protein
MQITSGVKAATWSVVVGLLTGAAIFVWIVVQALLEINREIDLCWDTSHPDYIWDDKTREERCNYKPYPRIDGH